MKIPKKNLGGGRVGGGSGKGGSGKGGVGLVGGSGWWGGQGVVNKELKFL